jgi:GTPase SAR1 family protein
VSELQKNTSPNTIIVLVGNKCDIDFNRSVEFDIANRFAKENSLLFLETSAKTNHNITELFNSIGRVLTKNDVTPRFN